MNAGPLKLSFRKVAAGRSFQNHVRLHLATDDFDLEGNEFDPIDMSARDR